MVSTFKAKEKDREISLSKTEICTTEKGKTLCVKIDEVTPYDSIIVTGLFVKDKSGKLIPTDTDIDTDAFKFLFRELQVEARIRRVGKIFVNTNNPMTFRLLKRIGFSTIPKSKKNNVCYVSLLENDGVCESGSIRLVKKIY